MGWRLANVADLLGTPLMPWQRLVADVGLELLPDGTPAYREVWVTVPRQNGKTTLVLCWELDRALNWSDGQRILYSAQNGSEAAKKLVVEQAPLIQRSVLKKLVRRVYLANGNESITFTNGSRIDILRGTEDSGHGKSLDFAVIDEAFADTDFRREGAILPALITKKDAQILGLSTAGTEMSVLLQRKVDLGRSFVEQGSRQGVAYFEWSADEADDIDDPDTWFSCMPALRTTITLDAVRHARSTMTEGEFRRAMLNQWTSADEMVIPRHVLDRIISRDVSPDGRLTLALDVTPERSAAAIAVCDKEQRCEVIEHNPGVAWVVERIIELAKKHRASVAIDPHGPAGSFSEALTRNGVKVVPVGGRDMAMACAGFYDSCTDLSIQLRKHSSLDDALAGATKKKSGDVWTWARSSTLYDISPLVAVTMAHHIATQTTHVVRKIY